MVRPADLVTGEVQAPWATGPMPGSAAPAWPARSGRWSGAVGDGGEIQWAAVRLRRGVHGGDPYGGRLAQVVGGRVVRAVILPLRRGAVIAECRSAVAAAFLGALGAVAQRGNELRRCPDRGCRCGLG